MVIAISFEIGLQTAPKNALKRCIFRLASAHFKSKRLYNPDDCVRIIISNSYRHSNYNYVEKFTEHKKIGPCAR